MKKQLWNSRSGNKKGFILSLDVSVAVIIVFIFIAVSAYYVGKASEDPLTRLQLIRAGSDVISILDQKNVFETLSEVDVARELSATLPPSYEMILRVNGTFPDELLTVDSTNQTLGNLSMVSGERSLVLYNETGNYFAKVRYWMWLKPSQTDT